MQYTNDFIGHIYEITPHTYDFYNIYMELYNMHTTLTTHNVNDFIEHIYGNIPRTHTNIRHKYQYSHTYMEVCNIKMTF